jgi:hypothetical protein
MAQAQKMELSLNRTIEATTENEKPTATCYGPVNCKVKLGF